MAELLDPSGQFFGGRIIAQGAAAAGAGAGGADDGTAPPGAEGAAVVKKLTQVRVRARARARTASPGS
jgi:hypothetical protein